MKRIIIGIMLLLGLNTTFSIDNNNDNNDINLKKMILDNYVKSFDILNDNDKINKNKDNKNNNKKNKENKVRIDFFLGKYKKEMDKKINERNKIIKEKLKKIKLNLLNEDNIKDNVKYVYNNLKKLNEKSYILIFKTNSNNVINFDNLKTSIILYDYSLFELKEKEKKGFLFLQSKINEILEDNNKKEKDKYNEIKELLRKYKIQFITMNYIINNKENNKYNIMIGEKQSFFEKPDLTLISSNYYSVSDKIKGSYLWTIITQKELDKFFNYYGIKDYQNNFQVFMKTKFDKEVYYTYYGKKDFFTIQYNDKIITAEIPKEEFIYKIKIDNSYIIIIPIIIIISVLLAYYGHQRYYKKTIKRTLENLTEKI